MSSFPLAVVMDFTNSHTLLPMCFPQLIQCLQDAAQRQPWQPAAPSGCSGVQQCWRDVPSVHSPTGRSSTRQAPSLVAGSQQSLVCPCQAVTQAVPRVHLGCTPCMQASDGSGSARGCKPPSPAPRASQGPHGSSLATDSYLFCGVSGFCQ